MAEFFINTYQVETHDGKRGIFPVSYIRYDATTRKFPVFVYQDYPNGFLFDVKGEDEAFAMVKDKLVLHQTKTISNIAPLVRSCINGHTRIDPSEVSDALEDGLYYTCSHTFTGTKTPEIKAEIKAIIA